MIACPTCEAATTVEETRGERRRRACTKCGRKLTTIEVVVENARRYDKIAVIPRKDLETIVRLAGKAMASLVGDRGVVALIATPAEAAPASDFVGAGTSAEATPASDADLRPRTEEAADEEPLDNALTEEELRAIGVDPDNEEQLAALGLIVQGSD